MRAQEFPRKTLNNNKFCKYSSGTLFFNIQASLGNYERKQISSRVKSGKWARIKVGRWQGGFLPVGHKKEKDGKTIIIEEVKAIFDM